MRENLTNSSTFIIFIASEQGVELSHDAVLKNVASQYAFLSSDWAAPEGKPFLDENDCYLSFLPLAHIFDRYVLFMILSAPYAIDAVAILSMSIFIQNGGVANGVVAASSSLTTFLFSSDLNF